MFGGCAKPASALSARLCTADPVRMRSTVGPVVLTQQCESTTSITELAETLGGAFFGEDPNTFHDPTLRASEHRQE
jgi:hypothetical protein